MSRQVTFAVAARPAEAAWWIDRLGLHGLEGRYPAELSGGQAQRVALARALAAPTRLLLLDEPLSALDTPVRRALRAELRRLQLETGLASVVVTHDPEEAAALADDIVVLDGGRVLQDGSRRELFGRPASVTVARLLGVANVHPGTLVGAGQVGAGAVAGQGPVLACAWSSISVGTAVLWSVDPEEVALSPTGQWSARVVDVVDLGRHTEAVVEMDGGIMLTCRHRGADDLVPGATTHFDLPPVDAWPAPAGDPAVRGGTGGVPVGTG